VSDEPRIAKLQALLQRIQRHAAEPRVETPRIVAAPPPKPAPPQKPGPPPLPPRSTRPGMERVQEKARVETLAWESPVESLLPGLGAPEPIDVSPAPAETMEKEPIAVSAAAGATTAGVTPPKEPTIQTREATPEPEPAEVEAISGEYAVYREGEGAAAASATSAEAEAEAPMELEELGPADLVEEGESVVEVQVDAPAAAPAPEEEIAARMESGPAPAPVEEPPASGREIVAAPTESSRMKVAAPLTHEKVELDRAESPEQTEPMAPVEAVESAEPLPPAPTSELRTVASERAPAQSLRSTQRFGRVEPPVSLPPPEIIEPPPKTPIPPIAEPQITHVEARPSIPPPTINEPPPKTPIPVAPAPEELPEPMVLRANVATPKHVAAFVEASRKPLPTTFVALLDDALSL
jgi:hypothetical protein